VLFSRCTLHHISSLLILFIFCTFLQCLSILSLQILCSCRPQCSHPIRRSCRLCDQVGNLASTDQGRNDTGSDNEGQDESVGGVPRRSPTPGRCARVGVVEESEGEELCDQTHFSRQEEGRPRNSRSNYSDGISRVALVTTKTCPFQAPVDSTKERDYLSVSGLNSSPQLECLGVTYSGAVSQLDRFDDMQ
jgi:hypothetical protein